MKAGYLQSDVRRDREENLRAIEAVVPGLGWDLAVLPELCLAGYLFKDREALSRVSEAVPDGPSTARLADLSARAGCAILFGLSEKEGDRLYNTAVLVEKGRYIGRYRKLHLTDYEKRFFERGTENPVLDLSFGRIGIQLCFDLWFPEVSREQVAQGARLLCALASFGGETTATVAPVRAIENMTHLVLCNRIGHETVGEDDATFLGKSQVIDRDGTVLALGPAGRPCHAGRELVLGQRRANVICADLDAEIALHAR